MSNRLDSAREAIGLPSVAEERQHRLLRDQRLCCLRLTIHDADGRLQTLFELPAQIVGSPALGERMVGIHQESEKRHNLTGWVVAERGWIAASAVATDVFRDQPETDLCVVPLYVLNGLRDQSADDGEVLVG